ncbi:MAG: radical SAM protein [Nitrospinae bacterium]|nr:radical SAM protein [Nitrospinota bacterium]
MNKDKKATIYLSDLVHNYLGHGSHMFPLNIGFIAAYAKKVFGDRIEVELFKYPDRLIRRLKEKTPDVLGMSHYVWNSNLNNEISKLARSLNPETMIVWGGPNVDNSEVGYKEFMGRHPAVDFCVVNEGEVGFANLLERYMANGCDVAKTKGEPVDGCVCFADGKPVVGKFLPRLQKLDDIPSPYLTGLVDKFFEEPLIPIVETNRGCPYSCTFCTQGLVSQNKIKMFDLERVHKELDYIGERVEKTNLFAFSDANFGIMARDEKIAEHIRDLQAAKNYPRRCVINWIKTKKSIDIAKIMGQATLLISSLQSLDPVVLKSIKRSNIDYSHFKEIIEQANETGGISGTEIILALPGETKESHINTIRRLFDWDVGYMICYNCLLIAGSELTVAQERERFAIKTMFRLVDTAFGNYDGLLSFEVEEGVRSTSTMSEEEVLFFRPVHWLIQFFWNYRCYFELLKFLGSNGVNPVDFIVKMLEKSNEAKGRVGGIFEDFRAEAKSEWFSTPEELRAHFSKPENFDMLKRGEIGKLNGKYTWRVLLECKKEFDVFVREVAVGMMPERKKEIENLVLFASQTISDFEAELDFDSVRKVGFEYDIFGWRDEKFKKPLVKKDVRCELYFSDEKKEALNTLLAQYKHPNRNVTMRKMSEHMRITDLYYDIRVL